MKPTSRVPIWFLLLAQSDAKPEEFPDLLQPNTIGYAKWAAALGDHGQMEYRRVRIKELAPESGS